MDSHREHRSGARVAVARLSVDLPMMDAVHASTVSVSGNISVGGVGFALKWDDGPALAVGDRLTIRFRLPDSLHETLVRAEVRHVTHHHESGVQRIGARFLDADELVSLPLFRYIEESLLAVRATSTTFLEGALAL